MCRVCGFFIARFVGKHPQVVRNLMEAMAENKKHLDRGDEALAAARKTLEEFQEGHVSSIGQMAQEIADACKCRDEALALYELGKVGKGRDTMLLDFAGLVEGAKYALHTEIRKEVQLGDLAVSAAKKELHYSPDFEVGSLLLLTCGGVGVTLCVYVHVPFSTCLSLPSPPLSPVSLVPFSYHPRHRSLIAVTKRP